MQDEALHQGNYTKFAPGVLWAHKSNLWELLFHKHEHLWVWLVADVEPIHHWHSQTNHLQELASLQRTCMGKQCPQSDWSSPQQTILLSQALAKSSSSHQRVAPNRPSHWGLKQGGTCTACWSQTREQLQCCFELSWVVMVMPLEALTAAEVVSVAQLNHTSYKLPGAGCVE